MIVVDSSSGMTPMRPGRGHDAIGFCPRAPCGALGHWVKNELVDAREGDAMSDARRVAVSGVKPMCTSDHTIIVILEVGDRAGARTHEGLSAIAAYR